MVRFININEIKKMNEKKKIKLLKFNRILKENIVIIGESFDWGSIGNKAKRSKLKTLGIEVSLMKKSYVSYFFSNTDFFKGNIMLISLNKDISFTNLEKGLLILEKEIGILPLFLINNNRVISINYLKGLLKEKVGVGSIPFFLGNNLKNNVNQFNLVSKSLIRIMSKVNSKDANN